MCLIQNRSLTSFVFNLLPSRGFQFWSTLILNVMKLEQEVIFEYIVGSAVFKISLTNNDMKIQYITFEMFNSYKNHWKKSNEQSDEFLK